MTARTKARPWLLDLFCGAGGAGEGYRQAGFDVTGVDLVARGYRAGPFVQADALTYLAEHGHRFDAIHASPPCHDHTSLAAVAGVDGSGDLLDETLTALRAQPRPWVVENVVGAAARMPGALMLCGSEFGLQLPTGGLRRHRLFLSSEWLMGAGGCCHGAVPVLGVYGNTGTGASQRGTKATVAEARELMGMPWADHRGVALAIPPAYTRFIGEQLLAVIDREVVA